MPLTHFLDSHSGLRFLGALLLKKKQWFSRGYIIH